MWCGAQVVYLSGKKCERKKEEEKDYARVRLSEVEREREEKQK